MSAKKEENRRKFEELIAELEAIVSDLEGGEIGLDQALERYEKGIAALKACYETLKAAEKRIEMLTKNPDGTFRTEPFEEGKAAPPAKEPEKGEKGEKPAPARGKKRPAKPASEPPAPKDAKGDPDEDSLF